MPPGAVERVPKPPPFIFSKLYGSIFGAFCRRWRALEPWFKKRPIGYLYRNYSCSFRTPPLRAARRRRATVYEIESAERTRKKSKSTRWIDCKWGGETTVNIEQTGQASEW